MFLRVESLIRCRKRVAGLEPQYTKRYQGGELQCGKFSDMCAVSGSDQLSAQAGKVTPDGAVPENFSGVTPFTAWMTALSLT